MKNSKGLSIAKEAEKPWNGKDLTLYDFVTALTNLHKENYPNDVDFLEYPKHHVWEKDGIQYSEWEISKGVFTGDSGIELYSKMVEEKLKNLPFEFFNKESSHDKPIT